MLVALEVVKSLKNDGPRLNRNCLNFLPCVGVEAGIWREAGSMMGLPGVDWGLQVGILQQPVIKWG